MRPELEIYKETVSIPYVLRYCSRRLSNDNVEASLLLRGIRDLCVVATEDKQ